MSNFEPVHNSAFNELGYRNCLAALYAEIQQLFLEDPHPWVVGYSGGKDSTAVLQLIWIALSQLPEDVRNRKKVHVISTDTLVENPIVSHWVRGSVRTMNERAKADNMPFEAHILHPAFRNSFWVNLIGKGYPRPWSRFRWCTDRLKIEPSNRFISQVANQYGETILTLGTRKQESQRRAAHMKRHEKHRLRDRLSPNAHVENCLVYTPIEDWSNDDVWTFLMTEDNPWGLSNDDLLELYKDATEDRECPMIIEMDEQTPSCGKSRFGCWTCTLVVQDSSLLNMVKNDPDKAWLQPLLDFRNHLTVKEDRPLRDFRRMKGQVQLWKESTISGPYLQSTREIFLRELLKTQLRIRELAPLGYKDVELISMNELREIRRIWLVEKHEIEDRLPKIYKDVLGHPFPEVGLQHHHCFGEEELQLLQAVCQTPQGEEDRLGYETIRELIDVEWNYRTKLRRAGLHSRLEQAIKKGFYDSLEDAIEFTREIDVMKKGTGTVQ